MKTSILQSMLAKNKSVINELQQKVWLIKTNRGYVLKTLTRREELSPEEELCCYGSVISWNLKIKKVRNQLKQYAIIQKAIKDEIKGE